MILRLAVLWAAAALLLAGEAQAQIYAKTTGTWNTAGNWRTTNCTTGGGVAGVPAAGNAVVICPGVTITLDVNSPAISTLDVQGTLNLGNNATGRTLTANGLITVAAGGTLRYQSAAAHTVNANGGITNNGTFTVNAASNSTSGLNVAGNIQNNSSFDLAPGLADDLVNTTFTGTGTMTVSGAGATTRFNRIIVSTGSATINNIVDVTATNFTLFGSGGAGVSYAGNAGTFRLSTGATVSPFGTAAYTIPANGRFWLNNAGATVTYPVNADLTLNGGILRVDLGSMTFGNALNNRLVLQSNAATSLQMGGGALSVAGRVASSPDASAATVGSFSMSGGTLTAGTVGNDLDTALGAPFLLAAGTTFTQSGGTVVIQRASTVPTPAEYDVRSTTSTVTGGTLQLGNVSTPAGEVFQLNSVPPLWNLTLSNCVGASLASAAATVNGALTFSTACDFSTGANTLRIGGAGSVVGAAIDRHVVGNLAKSFAAATTFLYPVGDGTSYTPVSVVFTAAATGSLTVAMTAAQAVDHPGTVAGQSPAEPNKSVNRYWTLKGSTIAGTATVTLNYASGTPRDLDNGVTVGSFAVGRGGAGTCSGSGTARLCKSWARPTLVGVPTTTQAVVSGIAVTNAPAEESDFVVGEARRVAREKEFIYTRETY